MRRFSLIVAFACLITGVVFAVVPETTWQALLNRQVVITNADGTQVTGTLALIKSKTISLIIADGSVVTLSRGSIEGVRAVVASPVGESTPPVVQPAAAAKPTTSRPKPAGSSASMNMGMRDADLHYNPTGWGLAGFAFGLLGVAVSYTANPTPSVAPDPTKVDVPAYMAGYEQEAKKRAHGAAWGGFGLEAAITLAVVTIAAVAAANSPP